MWFLLILCNVNTIADQNHVGIKYRLYRFDAAGTETEIYDSGLSQLLTVVNTLKGTTSVVGTLNIAALPAGTVGIGIKLYVVSNVGVTRTGNIFFQNTEDYTSVLTSFAVQQAPDLINLNNVWTGTNNFSNATLGALITTGSDAVFKGVRVGKGALAESVLLGSGTIANTGTASGSRNTIIGHNNASALTGGGYNNIIGSSSGTSLTTGNFNTFIGDQCGTSTTTLSNNTCVGYLSNVAVGLTSSSAFGTSASCVTAGVKIGSNSANVVLGGLSTTVTVGNLITLTGATPVITTSNAAGPTALLEISTISTGGIIEFKPKGTSVLQLDSGGITASKPLAMGSNAISGATTIGSSGNISCGGTIATTNATAANRAINNVNYNLIDIANVANTVGTIYGNSTAFYLEHKVASGNISLSVKPASGAAVSYDFTSSSLTCPGSLAVASGLVAEL